MTTLNMVLTVLFLMSIGIVLIICRQIHKRAERYDGLCGISENDTEQITIHIT
ncbi:hypothetical protein [Hespellia stercorisuis]|uniref:Uncharacterized protein n=1 Tax=Hespellia stercorisuis DSM 15480 TaxID=1121950 RepID=A0A1M6UMS8_9FIRM|nr:hypothetical protein [Hespellia stercorisuis]SHK70459.1 hypothetical protein SAMN02745243_03550 [Hespellia stercorisuis DSM 15480]